MIEMRAKMSFKCLLTIFLVLLYIDVIYSRTETQKLERKAKHSDCVENMCGETPGYPSKKIANMLKRNKKIYKMELFGTVIEPVPNQGVLLRLPVGLGEKCCRTRKHTVSPKVALDVDQVQRYIVNVKGHKQTVSFESCIEKQCWGLKDILVHYETACEQLYNSVRLLMYLPETKEFKFGLFSIPSACVCTYRKIDS